MRNTCITCKYYDGEICTKDIDMDEVYDENELYKASAILSKKLTELLTGDYQDVPVVTYGPFEAPVYKVENKYRMRMVIKCRLNRRSRAMFSHLLTDFSKSGAKGLSLSIDFNPSSL